MNTTLDDQVLSLLGKCLVSLKTSNRLMRTKRLQAIEMIAEDVSKQSPILVLAENGEILKKCLVSFKARNIKAKLVDDLTLVIKGQKSIEAFGKAFPNGMTGVKTVRTTEASTYRDDLRYKSPTSGNIATLDKNSAARRISWIVQK